MGKYNKELTRTQYFNPIISYEQQNAPVTLPILDQTTASLSNPWDSVFRRGYQVVARCMISEEVQNEIGNLPIIQPV